MVYIGSGVQVLHSFGEKKKNTAAAFLVFLLHYALLNVTFIILFMAIRSLPIRVLSTTIVHCYAFYLILL